MGNQLFQYAAGRRLAHIHNTSLKLELSQYSLDLFRRFGLCAFNHSAKIANVLDLLFLFPLEAFRSICSYVLNDRFSTIFLKKLDNKIHYLANRLDYIDQKTNSEPLLLSKVASQRYYHFDPEVLDLPDNTYLMGYWQNEKYFADIENILRHDLTFKHKLNAKNKKIAFQINNSNSVSIHIRRGDLLNIDNIVILDLEYYISCIEYIAAEINDPNFFVFSDDINWAKNNLKSKFNIIYLENNSPSEDLHLMSLCKHNIIANSSFSWWGAWLNKNSDKIVLVSKSIPWVFYDNFNPDDLYPKNWIKI